MPAGQPAESLTEHAGCQVRHYVVRPDERREHRLQPGRRLALQDDGIFRSPERLPQQLTVCAYSSRNAGS
jgi:hypothetical protein